MKPQQSSIQAQAHRSKLPVCTMCCVARADLARSGPILCTDCRELMDRAFRALSVARQDGCLKQGYDPSSWREAKNRLDHGAIHILQAQTNPGKEIEDHLAHAICDLVMCYELGG